jgi:hypothetical protein
VAHQPEAQARDFRVRSRSEGFTPPFPRWRFGLVSGAYITLKDLSKHYFREGHRIREAEVNEHFRMHFAKDADRFAVN